jgi:predicted RND superfamily exporter protein
MSRDQRERSLIDFVVERRHFLLLALILVTVFFAALIPGMKPDTSFESTISPTSHAFQVYTRFREVFGGEEYMLIAVKNTKKADDPAILESLGKVTEALGKLDGVVEVTSLANLRVFAERKGKFGVGPVLDYDGPKPKLPGGDRLEEVREGIPMMDLLMSPDRKTLGILVKLSEHAKFSPPTVERLLKEMRSVLSKDFPKDSDSRIVGYAVLTAAIQKYNIQTAIYFGLLCLIVAVAVSIYIFKSVRAVLITMVVIVMSNIWILGIMVLVDIRINSVTCLATGLVLIVSVAAVIHIVTHFNERMKHTTDRIRGAKEALRIVGRPCLMCSLTTGTGFASIMVSSIPMVRQLGLIMSLAVLASYILAIIIAPTLLIMWGAPTRRAYERMEGDWVASAYDKMEHFVFRRHGLCAWIGLTLVAVMIAGAPRIHSDTQLLKMLSDSTQEIRDIRFVEKNLAKIHSVEMTIEADDDTFKRPDAWKKISDLEKKIRAVPGVVRTDSPLRLLKYLQGQVSEPGTPSNALFTNPMLIPQLLQVITFSSAGKEMLARYVDSGLGKVRIGVRIINEEPYSVGGIIHKIRKIAKKEMKGFAEAHVTGQLAVFDSETSHLVRAQTLSLVIALSSITILMMIQFRSVLLGLLSLVPNVFPLVVIFGIMGWFGIYLDSVTIFAATVSIGLSVDDTIHYLTQLRREIIARGETQDIEKCLEEAYRITAKALISTSAVLFFGFASLVISPFRPVIFFGLLGSSAIVAALAGDLIFMPSYILSFEPFKRLVKREMASTVSVTPGTR